MIVITTGGRYFSDRNYVFECLDKVNKFDPIRVLIHGGCEVWNEELGKFVPSVADWIANDWAIENKVWICVESGREYFRKYGKRGGRIRNTELSLIALRAQKYFIDKESTKHDITTLAFKGGNGTNHMCLESDKLGFKVYKTWTSGWDEGLRQPTFNM